MHKTNRCTLCFKQPYEYEMKLKYSSDISFWKSITAPYFLNLLCGECSTELIEYLTERRLAYLKKVNK